LAEHQIRLIAIGGAERYGVLTSTFASDEAVFEDSNTYYCLTPPTVTLRERPESSLPQIAKQIEAQMKYTKDAVVFASIESITTSLRYQSKETTNESIVQTDKYLKNVIQEALVAGMRILLIGDSTGAESFGHNSQDQEVLLPVVFIAKDQEGLRASHEDYANDSVFPLKASGTVFDIAPTILSLMHIPKPEYFSGKNLFSESLN
jgi:bisphosphoglycerate-independent phosphoglycerate mutase (AlkP superfamily)